MIGIGYKGYDRIGWDGMGGDGGSLTCIMRWVSE